MNSQLTDFVVFQKMHPERHRLYEEYKVERGQTIKKRRTSHEYPAGKLSGTSSKRRSGNTISLISAFYSSGEADGPLPPNESFSENSPQPDTHSLSKRRQSSLGLQNSRPRPTAPKKRLNSLLQQGSVSAASLPPTIKARRKETDDIVFNFIIRSLSPTSLVESPHFISLVSGTKIPWNLFVFKHVQLTTNYTFCRIMCQSEKGNVKKDVREQNKHAILSKKE